MHNYPDGLLYRIYWPTKTLSYRLLRNRRSLYNKKINNKTKQEGTQLNTNEEKQKRWVFVCNLKRSRARAIPTSDGRVPERASSHAKGYVSEASGLGA